MTAYKNTGRAAHTLPKNIQQRRAHQRAGPIFNSRIKGLKVGKPSFRKLGKYSRKSNRFGQLKSDSGVSFAKGKLRANDVSRVYVPGVILGYKRSLKRQHPNRTLVEIIGCRTKESAKFYLGKRVVYTYKAKNEEDKTRTLVGKITRCHGNSGIVQVKFSRNISPTSFGKRYRVLLYPCTN